MSTTSLDCPATRSVLYGNTEAYVWLLRPPKLFRPSPRAFAPPRCAALPRPVISFISRIHAGRSVICCLGRVLGPRKVLLPPRAPRPPRSPPPLLPRRPDDIVAMLWCVRIGHAQAVVAFDGEK